LCSEIICILSGFVSTVNKHGLSRILEMHIDMCFRCYQAHCCHCYVHCTGWLKTGQVRKLKILPACPVWFLNRLATALRAGRRLQQCTSVVTVGVSCWFTLYTASHILPLAILLCSFIYPFLLTVSVRTLFTFGDTLFPNLFPSAIICDSPFRDCMTVLFYVISSCFFPSANPCMYYPRQWVRPRTDDARNHCSKQNWASLQPFYCSPLR